MNTHLPNGGEVKSSAQLTHAEALEKVRKLMRLATSSNPNEAALAASKAQSMIDRYKLESAALCDESNEAPSTEPISDFDNDPLEHSKRARWKDYLSMTLAKQNQCKVYVSNGALNLVGRASDVSTIRYLYGWLTREIERLATIHCTGTTRTYWNNFRLGAQETVCARLESQHRQTLEDMRGEARAHDAGSNGVASALGSDMMGELFAHSNRSALIVVERAIATVEKRAEDVEAFMKAKFPRMRKRRSHRVNYSASARDAGRQAGHSVGLRPVAGRLS